MHIKIPAWDVDRVNNDKFYSIFRRALSDDDDDDDFSPIAQKHNSSSAPSRLYELKFNTMLTSYRYNTHRLLSPVKDQYQTSVHRCVFSNKAIFLFTSMNWLVEQNVSL